jgi:hypothetical protein
MRGAGRGARAGRRRDDPAGEPRALLELRWPDGRSPEQSEASRARMEAPVAGGYPPYCSRSSEAGPAASRRRMFCGTAPDNFKYPPSLDRD